MHPTKFLHILLCSLFFISQYFHANAASGFGHGPRIEIGETTGDREIIVKKTETGEYIRHAEMPQPHLNIGYLGRGYDIVFGNPLETSVGGDKGPRLSVFKIKARDDHAADLATYSADWRFALPDHVDVMQKVSCDSSVSIKEISSTSEMKSEISNTVSTSTSASVDVSYQKEGKKAGVSAELEFSGSDTMRTAQSSLDSADKTAILSEAKCSIYEANLNPFKYPEFDEGFVTAVEALSKTYDHKSEGLYREFIDSYGTHVITSVLMGARYGRMYMMTKTAKNSADEQAEERERSESYGGKLELGSEEKNIEGSINAKHTKTKTNSKTDRREAAMADVADEQKTFSIGASYSTDPQEWAASAALDPMPLELKLEPIQTIVSKFFDPVVGTNLGIALSEYSPTGVLPTEDNWGKCYFQRSKHTVLQAHSKKTSLIARCKPGYKAIGGSFVHLFNVHDDVHVDALAATEKKIMEDLKKYHALEAQERAANYILEQGGNMLKRFTDARNMDDIKELFGDRIDPSLTKKFLEGTLRSLGLKKQEALTGVANGLKVFGTSPIGDFAKKMLGDNPYTSAIFNIGDRIMKDLPQVSGSEAQTLESKAASLNQPNTKTLSAQELNIVQNHANTLIEIFNSLDAKNGGQSFKDEAHTEFFDFIKDAVSKISDALKETFKQVKANLSNIHLKGLSMEALKHWEKFVGRLDDIQRTFGDQIKGSQNKIKTTTMYQDIMKEIEENMDPHGATLLAPRNALNWLFPYEDNAFVCGSGNLGMDATSRSSLGYCSALCCDIHDWKLETVAQKRSTASMEERSSVSVAKCPGGLSVVSGGILISEYQEGRFVQVVHSRPIDDSSWECKIKWTEETHIPYSPRFKCYARCARSKLSSVTCQTTSTTLVNGHGTAYCKSDEMALGGGWKVDSTGVTYFKKTAFEDTHPVLGPRGYRCEFGTSHAPIVGTCYARCCQIKTDAVQDVVVHNPQSCEPFYVRHGLKSLGARLNFPRFMKAHDVLHSVNNKYFATYNEGASKLEVFEDIPCRKPFRIGVIQFHAHRCDRVMRLPWGAETRIRVPTQMRVSRNGLEAIHDGQPCAEFDATANNDMNNMQITDGGNLIFYDDELTALREMPFSNCRSHYRKLGLKKSYLNNGEFILLNNGLVSENKKYMFLFLPSGDLVILYQNPGNDGGSSGPCPPLQVIWSNYKENGKTVLDWQKFEERSNNQPKEGWMLRLQEDNNLVVYNDKNEPMWNSETHFRGQGRARLDFPSDGDLQLNDAVGVTLWKPREGATRSCERLRERLKIRSHRLGPGSVMKPGLGGLMSKNEQYIVYIDATTNNLELWREGGADCKPVRLRVLKENVVELRFTTNSLVTLSGQVIHKFDDVLLVDLVLENNGHLIVNGGNNNRREQSVELFAYTPYSGKEAVKGEVKVMNWQGTMGLNAQTKTTCPASHPFMKGWTVNDANNLRGITHGHCGSVGAAELECVDADWLLAFDNPGWVKCPSGYAIKSVITTGSQLYNLEGAQCCKIKGKTTAAKCYEESRSKQLQNPGTYMCSTANHYIAGFQRETCDDLKCIQKWWCCEM